MKQQPGVLLTKTSEYGDSVGNPDTCPNFFGSAYNAVYNDAKNYIAEYGCVHDGTNGNNVLFEYDTGRV